MRDVAIVGGGPGGLHAATLLARAGLDVALFEEHASSGSPVHCTGVLAAEAFDEFGLAPTAILNPLRTARFFSPSGQSISYSTATIEAVAIDRLAFDTQLFDLARRAGAQISLGQRVDDVAIDGDAATLRFRDGRQVRARMCVLACGANYTLQRRLGLGMPSVYMQSAQLEMPASPGARCDVELHFGRDVAPNGFAWIVPVRREQGWHVRVGLMCERDSATYFRRFVARVTDRWHIDPAARDEAPRQKLLPLSPVARTYGDRLLAVGDAAGLVKATTGGGIYYSVMSAQLAAETLTRAFAKSAFDARTLSQYERQWNRQLGAEMRAQLHLRELAHRLEDVDIEAFFDLARTDGVMPIVRRTGRFNQHRGLIVALLRHPPARRILLGRLRGRASSAHGTLDERTA
jgi:geranylgeranyl reductase family protein